MTVSVGPTTESAATGARLEEWRRRFTGAGLALDLPADRPRSPVAGPALATVRVALGAGALDGARDVRRRDGELQAARRAMRKVSARAPAVALAAFLALLHRYTGRRRFLIAIALPDGARPLVAELDGDPRFGELAATAEEELHGAESGEGVPLDRLVAALDPDLRVALAVRGREVAAPDEDAEGGGGAVDLALVLNDADGEVRAATLRYRPDLFDRSTAERFAGQLAVLHAAALADPERRLSELPYLTVAERRRLLAEWSDAPPLAGPVRRLEELVAAQAVRTPQATALIAGTERLTYRDLDRWAERIAALLAARGIEPEERVAIALARGPAMVAAILGVLKAGGAYLPLDPAYPRERLAFMLADSGARWVLTQESLLAALPESAAEPLLLDGGPEALPPPAAGGASGARRRRPPRLPDLHLRLDRAAEGGGDRPPQRRRPARVGARGVRAGGAGRRAGLDLDLLRPLGVRAVPAAGQRRHGDPRGRRPGAAAAAGCRRRAGRCGRSTPCPRR